MLLDEALDAILEAEPLELARDELVARHHRLHLLLPLLARERAAAGLLRLELARILVGLVVVAGD